MAESWSDSQKSCSAKCPGDVCASLHTESKRAWDDFSKVREMSSDTSAFPELELTGAHLDVIELKLYPAYHPHFTTLPLQSLHESASK